jgi:putative transposase
MLAAGVDGDVHKSETLVQPVRTLRVLRTPIRAFAVRLHAASCSLRETEAILHLLGVERSFQAIFQWVPWLANSVADPPKAKPRRVAIDETAVKINGGRSWSYAAIALDTKLILDVALFKRHGTDPAAAFLHGVCQKHDCSETIFWPILSANRLHSFN